MDITNYKQITKSINDMINTLVIPYGLLAELDKHQDVVNSAQRAVETGFEREVVNECIKKSVDAALQTGEKWDEYPGTEKEAIDFGDPQYNFSYSLLSTYRIDKDTKLSFTNSQMYNAFNNISMDAFYKYMMLTRFELPQPDEIEYFNEMTLKYHNRTMAKLEAIKFIHKYTSDTKFHEFLETGKVERDEDI